MVEPMEGLIGLKGLGLCRTAVETVNILPLMATCAIVSSFVFHSRMKFLIIVSTLVLVQGQALQYIGMGKHCKQVKVTHYYSWLGMGY